MPRYSDAYLAAHARLPHPALASAVRLIVAAHKSASSAGRLELELRAAYEAIPPEARAYWEEHVPERNRVAARRRYAEKRAASRERSVR